MRSGNDEPEFIDGDNRKEVLIGCPMQSHHLYFWEIPDQEDILQPTLAIQGYGRKL